MPERPPAREDTDFFVPTRKDLDALRMENELLAFEVRFLRAMTGTAGRGSGVNPSLHRFSSLEEAENDLFLLVRRMSGSALGPVFRRSQEWRTLEDRYLKNRGPRDGASNADRLAYLEAAERDLQLLLRRLDRSPLAPVLRRKGEFRTLKDRYL